MNNYSEQLISANGPDSLAMSASCMKIVDDEPGYRAQIVLHARSSWYESTCLSIRHLSKANKIWH